MANVDIPGSDGPRRCRNTSPGRWIVRRATPADRDGIADLCRAAVGPDDYFLEALDPILRKDVVHVALDGPRIVGSMTCHETLDRAGWLGAARTHPEVRRQGVASVLVTSFDDLARSRGLHALRLWTDASNTAGVAAFLRSGFREVRRFTRMSRAADPATRGPALRTVREPESSAGLLTTSPWLAASGGFASVDYAFVRITPETLKTFAARGTLREWPGGLVVLSEVTEAFRQEILEIFPLLGEPAEILSAGPRIAAALGRERLEIFLPRDAALLEAAEAAGFEPMAWGREAILSEKPVRA